MTEVEKSTPAVFISYAWESKELKEWVSAIATRLRGDGIDVRLDQWHLEPGDHVASFMESAVRESDYVLIVCTPEYKRRSNSRTRGIGYEGDVMTGEVLEYGIDKKFIPLWRSGEKWSDAAPSWLLGKLYLDFRQNWATESSSYDSLTKLLHGRFVDPPELGPIPKFARQLLAASSIIHASLDHICDVLYLDDKRLSTYLDRFEGPALAPDVSNTRRVGALLTTLERAELLSTTRPERMTRCPRPFVLETMHATKVILKDSAIASVPSLREFAVWVSGPALEATAAHGNSSYTFLYLTEAVWEDGHFHTVYSGCSALQAVANLNFGNPILSGSHGEPLGRGDTNHPIEKLRHLGATISPSRQIVSLYRTRYLTDEQVFLKDGVECRTYDLLGYPIFIADCL